MATQQRPADNNRLNAPEVYRAFRFLVKIDGEELAGFSQVSGFGMRVETVPYRWGDDKLTSVRELPTVTQFENITLSKGVMDAYTVYDWILSVASTDTQRPTGQGVRKNMTITLVNNQKEQTISWEIYGAMPVSYRIADLDAMEDGVLMESLELSILGFSRVNEKRQNGSNG